MPARDLIHYQVRTALERDGWKITSDPLFIPVEGLSGLFIDIQNQKVVKWRV
jgi:XisH protein